VIWRVWRPTPTYLDGIPEGPQGRGWLNRQMEPMIQSQMGKVQIMGKGAGHSTEESQLLEPGEQVDQEIWTWIRAPTRNHYPRWRG